MLTRNKAFKAVSINKYISGLKQYLIPSLNSTFCFCDEPGTVLGKTFLHGRKQSKSNRMALPHFPASEDSSPLPTQVMYGPLDQCITPQIMSCLFAIHGSGRGKQQCWGFLKPFRRKASMDDSLFLWTLHNTAHPGKSLFLTLPP